MYQLMIGRKKIGKSTDYLEVARLQLRFNEVAYIQYSKKAIKLYEANKNVNR